MGNSNNKTVYHIMKSRDELTVFINLIDKLPAIKGWITTNYNEQYFTILAPTNEAFSTYLINHNYITQATNDVDMIINKLMTINFEYIVKSHIQLDKTALITCSKGSFVSMLSNKQIIFADIIKHMYRRNIPATNGMIHIVNIVIE